MSHWRIVRTEAFFVESTRSQFVLVIINFSLYACEKLQKNYRNSRQTYKFQNNILIKECAKNLAKLKQTDNREKKNSKQKKIAQDSRKITPNILVIIRID